MMICMIHTTITYGRKQFNGKMIVIDKINYMKMPDYYDISCVFVLHFQPTSPSVLRCYHFDLLFKGGFPSSNTLHLFIQVQKMNKLDIYIE